jgi:cytochrome c oxidase subunit 6b
MWFVSQCQATEEVHAPPPPTPKAKPPPPPPPPSLKDLAPDEIEELKQQIVNEVIDKLAGEDGSKIADFFEPELMTAPYDPRFPNRNQARHCFVRFNEYYKCIHDKGEEDRKCVFYKQSYQSMCPSEWVENWMEMREAGLWTGKY